MKRTFALILAAVALFAGLVYAVLVAAHVSEPAATTVYGPRRLDDSGPPRSLCWRWSAWSLVGWLCADPPHRLTRPCETTYQSVALGLSLQLEAGFGTSRQEKVREGGTQHEHELRVCVA
jgi:hypothetical protein